MKKQLPDLEWLRPDARAEYRPPRLESYGTVASITGSSPLCSVTDMTDASWGMAIFDMMVFVGCKTT